MNEPPELDVTQAFYLANYFGLVLPGFAYTFKVVNHDMTRMNVTVRPKKEAKVGSSCMVLKVTRDVGPIYLGSYKEAQSIADFRNRYSPLHKYNVVFNEGGEYGWKVLWFKFIANEWVRGEYVTKAEAADVLKWMGKHETKS